MGELFDYVMHTPGNTNPAVLSSEIQKLIDENIVQPDWNQYINTKKDYIKNKPLYMSSYDIGEEWVDIKTPKTGDVILIKDFSSYSSATINYNYSYNKVAIFPPATTSPCFLNTHTIYQGREGTSYYRLLAVLSSISKIDEDNYKYGNLSQGTVYFILNTDKLSEENKNKFSKKGIYLVKGNFDTSRYDLYEWKITSGIAHRMDPILLPTDTQGKTISDSNNYFSTKTVEGALDQIGSQLDEYFGYTIEEDSVINGTYNSGTVKVPIDGFEFGTCYLARGLNEDFIAGYPIHTNQGIIALGDIASYSKYKAVISAVTDNHYNLNFLTDPPFLSTTEGEVALKFYPIHFDKKTKELLAMELGSGYVSPDNLVTSPVFFRDGKLVTTERVDVKQYFDGAPDALVEGGLGYGTVFLEPASTENQDSRYSSWGLTAEDYPLMATMTKQELSGTSPTYEYKVVTSTGRCFKVGGTAATASSWSPTEVYPNQLIVKSSTADSTKNFKITVDDTGILTATEITET